MGRTQFEAILVAGDLVLIATDDHSSVIDAGSLRRARRSRRIVDRGEYAVPVHEAVRGTMCADVEASDGLMVEANVPAPGAVEA